MSIPKRSEVIENETWDLSSMFENDDAWNQEYEMLKGIPEKAESYKGQLGNSADTLLSFFRLQDEITVRLEKLIGYANCKCDEDTSVGKYLDMRGKSISVYVSIVSAFSFDAPEIMAITDERLNEFLTEKPELAEYNRTLYQIRRKKAHILSPECEAILAAAGELAESPSNIYSILENSDLKYPNVLDSNGEEHQLADSTFVPLLESPDRTLRENAFKAYYSVKNDFKGTIAATLDAQFKQLKFFSDSRKYSSTIEASLDATEVPVPVYTNLIEAVHNNLDKMYHYVSLRKKMLGVDSLHMYDVYTPIVSDVATTIPYDQAKSTILNALGVLGDDYIATLKEGFDNRWIDVYPNEGKRSGAYSSSVSRPHPFVLMNYKDNLDSQFTLAHEMGHSLHSYLSTANQPVSTSDYVIFVAEVASTCNEILLMKYLLKTTEDKRVKAYLINHFLDQFKGTLYRQTMFAEFELELGKMVESGQTLTADVLSEKYHELNKLYFGPEMVSDDEIALEWARIPHFFYNYYVFQYATGFSAAVAIANRILNEGAPAVADYKRFLSGGSSTDPISLLKIAGVDMSSPKPINDALSLFDNLIDELEALLK